jgi:C4-dicarboxylate transporter DctQ subunit
MSIGFILAVIFSALLFIFGVSMAAGQYQRGQVTAGIQAPEWIFGAFVPFGAFFITIRFAQALVRTIKQPAPVKGADSKGGN